MRDESRNEGRDEGETLEPFEDEYAQAAPVPSGRQQFRGTIGPILIRASVVPACPWMQFLPFSVAQRRRPAVSIARRMSLKFSAMRSGKMPDPDTTMSAPAPEATGAVSTLIPPST